MSTQVILLQRVENLGAMGDVVSVKPGYARNFLLPQAKALRATKENIAYYEAQKSHLQKANAEKKGEADKMSKNVEGVKVTIIRQASEGGQLFGSVSSRDIAEALSAESKQVITRGMVALNQNFKTIGLFPVDVALHPEVKVKVTVNIARSEEEAAQQAKSGKAVTTDARGNKSQDKDLEESKASMLEEGALANEKAEAKVDAEREAEASEKAAKKAAKKPKKEASADVEEDEAPATIG